MNKDIFKDKDSLKMAIDGFFDDRMDVSRSMMEQVIARNILYYIGEQYLEYLPTNGQFRRRAENIFVPTPVSNEIREYVRSIVSLLMNQKMVPRVWPNTDEKEDIQAADAGQMLLVSLDQQNEGRFFDEKEKLIIQMCLSGTAFMRVYADFNSGIWLPTGSKTGEVASECIIPFNVRLDILGDVLENKRWVGIQSLKDKELVEDTFKVKIESNDKDRSEIDYQRYLSKLVSNVSPFKGRPIVVGTDTDDDLILFREVEFAPSKINPEGLYVVCAGGKVIYTEKRLPILSANGEWSYSLTDFHYNRVPGRFWSDPAVNDLISMQNTINEIDQSLAINRKGMGRPKILTAGDVGLKKIGIGGHGFIALSYNPIMGQKPDFKEGIALPPQVLEERKFQKQQLQDSAGDPKNVLRGQQPSANASGVLTDGLRETAERGKYPDIERFNRALSRVYKKRLLVAKDIMTEERIIKIVGRGNKIKVSKFKASDLKGNTDVRLELDSGLITTKTGQAQMFLQMVQNGFFDEGKISPLVRQEILQRMGMSTFTDEINNDVERAENENVSVASGEVKVMLAEPNPETGEDEVVNLDPLFKYDDHQAHFETHRRFIISSEFAELPWQYQKIMISHTDLHQKMISDKPVDIREYVQIDKILLPGILKESERNQVIDRYLGIQPGDEAVVGIPSADVVLKTKQRSASDDNKLLQKQNELRSNIMMKGMDNAIQNRKSEGRGEGGQPKKKV